MSNDPPPHPQPQIEPQPKVPKAEREHAKLLFMEGQAFFEQGDYAAALDRFGQAYVHVPMPALKYNMAHCLERLGHARDACAAYVELRDDDEFREVATQAITRLGC